MPVAVGKASAGLAGTCRPLRGPSRVAAARPMAQDVAALMLPRNRSAAIRRSVSSDWGLIIKVIRRYFSVTGLRCPARMMTPGNFGCDALIITLPTL